MKMITRIVWLMCMLGMAFAMAWAADAPTSPLPPAGAATPPTGPPAVAPVPTPYTLAQCLQIALSQQSDILGSKQSIISAQARDTETRSAREPTASIGYNNRLLGSSSPPSSAAHTNISVNYTVYDSGLRDKQIEQADLGLTSTLAGADRTAQQVVYDVTSAYLNVLRSEGQLAADDAQVAYAQDTKKSVEARIAAGDAAAADVLQVNAQLANVQVGRLADVNAVRIAKIRLVVAMGLTAGTEITIKDIDAKPEPLPKSMDQYIQDAMDARPDLKQADLAVTIAEASRTATRISTNPQVVVSASADQPLFNGSSMSWSVSAGLSYDFYTAGRNKAQVDAATAALTQSQIQAMQARRDIEFQVRQDVMTVANAYESLGAAAAGLDAAQKSYDTATARYKAGLDIPLDVLNAQAAMQTSELNAINARYQYYSAVAQLRFDTGQPGVPNE